MLTTVALLLFGQTQMIQYRVPPGVDWPARMDNAGNILLNPGQKICLDGADCKAWLDSRSIELVDPNNKDPDITCARVGVIKAAQAAAIHNLPLASIPLAAVLALWLTRKRLHGDVPRWWSPETRYTLKRCVVGVLPLVFAVLAPALFAGIVLIPAQIFDVKIEGEGKVAVMVCCCGAGLLAFGIGAAAVWANDWLKPRPPK
jgi:hypothetical protein